MIAADFAHQTFWYHSLSLSGRTGRLVFTTIIRNPFRTGENFRSRNSGSDLWDFSAKRLRPDAFQHGG